MTDQEFQALYPMIIDWVQSTLDEHQDLARPVSSFAFERLSRFYDAGTLANSKVVVLEKVPVPPLSRMGLDRFREFERMSSAGITYLDTYFLRSDHAQDESLHFHELVHVIQWQLLGPEKFLAKYADGLERFGYRNSPLEVMAYDLQRLFETEERPFEVAEEVKRRLSKI
ncbi:MAG TPA: hypothetical protein VEC99_09550 [Clostridia bacterium]|nr:hypothetical protein [Clostridia bacterium]